MPKKKTMVTEKPVVYDEELPFDTGGKLVKKEISVDPKGTDTLIEGNDDNRETDSEQTPVSSPNEAEETKKEEVTEISTEVVEPLKPAIPASESLALALVAKKLWESGLFPNVSSPAGAFAVAQYGREMNVPPMTALQNISIIKGKLAVNGNLMLSLALRAGVRVEELESSDEGCSLRFTREGYADVFAGFTIEEAKRAGLLKEGSGYSKYPKDMYYWRAIARGLRRIAPDVTVGLYTVEEITDGMHLTVDEVETELAKPTPRAITQSQNGQSHSPKPINGGLATEKQLKYLYVLSNKLKKVPDKAYERYITWRGQADSELTMGKAKDWIEYFNKLEDK